MITAHSGRSWLSFSTTSEWSEQVVASTLVFHARHCEEARRSNLITTNLLKADCFVVVPPPRNDENPFPKTACPASGRGLFRCEERSNRRSFFVSFMPAPTQAGDKQKRKAKHFQRK